MRPGPCTSTLSYPTCNGVQMLEANIQEQESKVGNADPSSLTYSMLALRAGRDNIRFALTTVEPDCLAAQGYRAFDL